MQFKGAATIVIVCFWCTHVRIGMRKIGFHVRVFDFLPPVKAPKIRILCR